MPRFPRVGSQATAQAIASSKQNATDRKAVKAQKEASDKRFYLGLGKLGTDLATTLAQEAYFRPQEQKRAAGLQRRLEMDVLAKQQEGQRSLEELRQAGQMSVEEFRHLGAQELAELQRQLELELLSGRQAGDEALERLRQTGRQDLEAFLGTPELNESQLMTEAAKRRTTALETERLEKTMPYLSQLTEADIELMLAKAAQYRAEADLSRRGVSAGALDQIMAQLAGAQYAANYDLANNANIAGRLPEGVTPEAAARAMGLPIDRESVGPLTPEQQAADMLRRDAMLQQLSEELAASGVSIPGAGAGTEDLALTFGTALQSGATDPVLQALAARLRETNRTIGGDEGGFSFLPQSLRDKPMGLGERYLLRLLEAYGGPDFQEGELEGIAPLSGPTRQLTPQAEEFLRERLEAIRAAQR